MGVSKQWLKEEIKRLYAIVDEQHKSIELLKQQISCKHEKFNYFKMFMSTRINNYMKVCSSCGIESYVSEKEAHSEEIKQAENKLKELKSIKV